MSEIFEITQDKQELQDSIRSLMTESEWERGKYYSDLYAIRRSELDAYKEEWDDLEKLYDCERDPDAEDEYYPNSFMPILTPIVEGQVASIMESNIEYNYSTNNPAHRSFMTKLEAASKYIRGYNQSHRYFKDYARTYDLLGNAWVVVSWEKSISNSKNKPKGFPRLSIPPMLSVLVDGRIKDYKDLQYAEYIIHEIGFQTVGWARKEYKSVPDGQKKVDAICLSTNRHDGETTEELYDDHKSFMLLHVWTRNNEQGNLQLIEMTPEGLILRQSDPKKPYYEKVDNEYPFYFGRMIPRLGRFYGYGDGKILKVIQQYANGLADELMLACRFSAQTRTYVDSRTQADLDQFDSDPSHPILVENPNGNVKTVPGMGINDVIPRTLGILYDFAQRGTRFPDIMTGNQTGVSATATQINGQLSQGNAGVNDKKSDLEIAMAWVDRYCLKLCLEKWDTPFWANLTAKAQEYVDMSALNSLPASVPLTAESTMKYIEQGLPAKDIPVFETLEENGSMVMTELDFDVSVSIGTEFPTDKNSVFNRTIALMQIQAVNPATGQMETFLSWKVAREICEEIMGRKLSDEQEPDRDNPNNIPMQGGTVNPLGASGNVQMPMGSQVGANPLPTNLASTMVGAGTIDKRGMSA